MFGLRWITVVSLRWHRKPTCRALKTVRTRCGWRPFLITTGYGRDFYTPCGICAPPPKPNHEAAIGLPGRSTR